MPEMTLFDAQGKAAAYIVPDEGNRVYLWSGEPVAYLAGDVLFGFNGSHLGWFEDGIVRDLKGEKVGFLKRTCPVEAQDEPPRDIKKTRVMRGSQEQTKEKPKYKDEVSSTPLAIFLSTGRD